MEVPNKQETHSAKTKSKVNPSVRRNAAVSAKEYRNILGLAFGELLTHALAK